jgi:hypothetical protein
MLKTLKEIKEDGWNALVDKLGIAGATMFIMEQEKGYGDYTRERQKIFAEKSLNEIIKEIKELKSEK